MGLDGKVCVMTGGGSGIGRSAAIMMVAEGTTIVAVGRTLSKVEDVKAEIEAAGGTAAAFGLDVADHEAVNDMTKSVLDSYGKIDILVNNAGHSSVHRKLLTTTPEELRQVVESNLMGTVFCTQAAIPSMLEAKRGTIINVSSMAGTNPSLLAGMSYSAAKAAVINFTHFLSAEYVNTGIRATVVIPGEVDTPIMNNRPVPPSSEARETMVPAEDAAAAIALIARLDWRTAIPELVIRPTMRRDMAGEIGTS